MLELSESELSALEAGVEGLDSSLPTLPANLAGVAFFFFASSELLELLSESELLCVFFVAACDLFVAGVAALVVGFTGAFLSELSESELSEDELESFFTCPGLTATFAGFEVFFTTGCLAESLFPTFFLSSSELESESLSELDSAFLVATAFFLGGRGCFSYYCFACSSL